MGRVAKIWDEWYTVVRVFIGGEEAEYNENGTQLALKEGDDVTFVRLAMLAGRMF